MTSSLAKIKCIDLKNRHKKAIYHSSKNPLRGLGHLQETLQRLYPKILLSKDDKVCIPCYALLLEEVKDVTPPSSSSSSQKSSEEIHDSEILVHKLNETANNLNLKISPIKMPETINIKMRKSYATRKRKQMNDAFDSQVASKMMKFYEITDLPRLSENIESKTCDKWFENIRIALRNCSSFSEKVRLLTLIPTDFPREYLLSVLPDVTMYMINQARSLVNNQGVYKKLRNYNGHSLNEDVVLNVLEYYLNDDFNCSRQSANKNDTISVKENGIKTIKVKRFLTRSIREMYELFKEENPEMEKKVGKSTFYALRPKWVILHPPNDTCLCVYCENLRLMLVALKNYNTDNKHDISEIESRIFSSLFCSKDDMKCVLGDCEKCPFGETIYLEAISLTEEDYYEEITYGIWEKSDLLHKTSTIEEFLIQLRKHALTVSTHKMIKEIQRVAIREAKILVKNSQFQLVIHVDFAENWTVLLQNEIQSYHWGKNQISVFTSICYFGNDSTVSYVTVSDDTKHDSSHALMAINSIIEDIKQKHNLQELEEIIIISDGAASHFKNRYQFYEFRNSKENRRWLFSATGHGKGACDAIGGLVKHYATMHNLSKPSIEFIRNAEDFVTRVPDYTPSINILLLNEKELEIFRQIKKVEWQEKTKEVKGIQKIHCWKTEQNLAYMSRTSMHEWEKIN